MTSPLHDTDWHDTNFYCGRPADAPPSEITLHARQGCIPCRFDPRNLDRLSVMEDVTVYPGEGICQRCKATVKLHLLTTGATLVINPDGSPHQHEAWQLPLGTEAKQARRRPAPPTILDRYQE